MLFAYHGNPSIPILDSFILPAAKWNYLAQFLHLATNLSCASLYTKFGIEVDGGDITVKVSKILTMVATLLIGLFCWTATSENSKNGISIASAYEQADEDNGFDPHTFMDIGFGITIEELQGKLQEYDVMLIHANGGSKEICSYAIFSPLEIYWFDYPENIEFTFVDGELTHINIIYQTGKMFFDKNGEVAREGYLESSVNKYIELYTALENKYGSITDMYILETGEGRYSYRDFPIAEMGFNTDSIKELIRNTRGNDTYFCVNVDNVLLVLLSSYYTDFDDTICSISVIYGSERINRSTSTRY